MSKRASNYRQVLKLLDKLHKSHPTISLGQHLATILDGYGDIWGITDKEFLFAIEKYMVTIEMDEPISTDEEIQQIIEDGKNIDKMFQTNNNDEQDDDEYEEY